MKHRQKILVVEDSPEDMFLLVRVLSRLEGYEIIQASSFGECQRAFEKNKAIRAVFLDLSLPDSTSMFSIAWIREHQPHVPIFVVTGDSMAVARPGLYDAGAIIVFPKPYTSLNNSAVLNLLDVNRASYNAGLGRRSWRTSLCGGIALACIFAGFFIGSAEWSVKLNQGAMLAVAVGLMLGADAKAVLQTIKKNGTD